MKRNVLAKSTALINMFMHCNKFKIDGMFNISHCRILCLVFERLSKYTVRMPMIIQNSSYLHVRCLCQHLQVSRWHALTRPLNPCLCIWHGHVKVTTNWIKETHTFCSESKQKNRGFQWCVCPEALGSLIHMQLEYFFLNLLLNPMFLSNSIR